MFKEHPVIDSNITGNAKLWRYMDFAKLVSLISNQSLYFCRSDKFKDLFEGKLIGFKVEDMYRNLENIVSNEYIFEGKKLELDKDSILGRAEEFTEQIYRSSEHERKNTFINCWHLNEFESAAMWDLYLKSNEGIAIQTTFDRLKGSLNICKEEIYIGKVKYIDYTNQTNFFGNTLSPFFTKRISFSHENEVRLLYSAGLGSNFEEDLDKGKDIYGKSIKVDFTNLIECIYVSPDAPSWFVEVVEEVVKKFNIETEIIHSDLYKIK